MYKSFKGKEEIATSAKSMVNGYHEKGVPREFYIPVWCKCFLLNELVLMLFDATVDSSIKTSFFCLVRNSPREMNHFFFPTYNKIEVEDFSRISQNNDEDKICGAYKEEFEI